MNALKFIFAPVSLLIISGCASNAYPVTYNSFPTGAQLYCDGVAKGYTPVTLYYKLDEDAKKRGFVYTIPCVVKWASGASADANRQFSLSQFPNGAFNTVPRPLVSGYSQDAEFSLTVENMKANQKSTNSTQHNSIKSVLQEHQNYQKSNTVQCKRMGQFINVEIKTFQGLICPIGWFPAY